MSSDIRTAIKRTYRVCKKFLQSRRSQDDMNSIEAVQYEVSTMIHNTKEDYCFQLDNKLSDPCLSTK